MDLDSIFVDVALKVLSYWNLNVRIHFLQKKLE